jgi:protoporphyrinogen oxidase
MREHGEKKVVMIGAGPAGLTAAYELCKAGVRAVVIEKDSIVGGLSKTLKHKGYHFDIGGHRFFTKVKAVEKTWHEVLPNGDFLKRNRLSRIYYNKKLFYYPLRIPSTFYKLGVWNSFLIAFSYLHARLSPARPEQTFEQWVTNRFGKRLFRLFFKTYTEKVWGLPCDEISAEWAAQRIKDLSLHAALTNVIRRKLAKNGSGAIKTLINEFHYPKRGPGMMWETMAAIVQKQGTTLQINTQVDMINWEGGAVRSLGVTREGKKEVIEGTHFISSMPIRELVQKLHPSPPQNVLDAAKNLHYRDFLIVALIVNRRDIFPDNWLYIHNPDVRLGRIQNFKNWSPDMVPDDNKTCLGLEYFCFEQDNLWSMSDAELVSLGTKELESLGLLKEAEVDEGVVVRVQKAYPVYDSTYREALLVIRKFLSNLGNLQLVGRNGMHKYNNQDHSMLTAMWAVENILGAKHDLWEVNADDEYHEQSGERGRQLATLASTQPIVPQRRTAPVISAMKPEVLEADG